MAVYGYARVSTDAQASDGESLAVQQRQLEGWAQMHGKVLDAMHVEAGVSGAVPFAERPEGAALWAKLTKGDVLVASKLDRVFRSAGDCLSVVETLKARGEFLGGKPPFGWRFGDGHELLPEPTQQAALTRMRAMRAAGAPLRKIAKEITAEGIAISHEGVKKVLAAADRPAA